jgi:hypothetical protein
MVVCALASGAMPSEASRLIVVTPVSLPGPNASACNAACSADGSAAAST